MAELEGLAALYAEALHIGTELCTLLEQKDLPEQLSQVEALLERRQHLADEAGRLAAAGTDLNPYRTQLEQIIAQQATLERLFSVGMAALKKRIGSHQAQQQSVDAVRRLLKNTGRSQTLNTRR